MSASTDAAPRTARPARARSLACPNCGAPVTVRASGISITAACSSCGSVLDVANEDVRLITNAAQNTRQPLIELGTRGTLVGTLWEAIGYQVRSSEAGSWTWEEWLLFNPYQGFRFLSLDHGHWTLYSMLRETVAPSALGYTAEEAVTATTDYVLGEFYWRVKAGDTVEVHEYSQAPYTLSEERSGGEVTWSRGIYMEPSAVAAAFPIGAMPPRSGRAAHEPADNDHTMRRLWLTAAAAFVVLLVLTSVNFGGHGGTVFSYRFQPTADDKDRTLASPVFTLPNRGGNVRLEVRSSGSADTLALSLGLVAEQDTPRFDRQLTITRADGRLDADVTLASVPGGAYKLLATPTATLFGQASPPKPSSTALIPFDVTVVRHPSSPSNFWLAALALLAWPLGVTVWRWFQGEQDRPA